MLQLPKHKRDPKEIEGLCKCRPVCKSRRREWKGAVQKTSAELKIERTEPSECFRRFPHKVYENGPCPLFGAKNRLVTEDHDAVKPTPTVVRICQAPIDDTVSTPYLDLAKLAAKLGSNATIGCSPFCKCKGCCPCDSREYKPLDAERQGARTSDMHQFDARVKKTCHRMRIMYE